MTTVQSFLERAAADRPVYMCDIRDAFQREGTRPFHIRVRLLDGGEKRFELMVPECADGAEARFVAEYLNATVYNLLSTLGARELAVYVDSGDRALRAFAESLSDTFQADVPLSQRRGYGRCLNVNERTLRAVCGEDVRFRFTVGDLADAPEASAPAPEAAAEPVFHRVIPRAATGLRMGMDIGGTDVKLAASVDGKICAFKEYDWNPAACAWAREIVGPLVLLTRLMRAAACMTAQGLASEIPSEAFEGTADDAVLLSGIEAMEARLGDGLRGFDSIGLCFPDVVVKNRVVGGETPKTAGLRANPEVDYETEFAGLTGLCDALRPFTRSGGAVLNINDGPMAAFTTAVEQTAAGRDLSAGCFAHTLGTDLGTGWIRPDGSIPEIPLEVYNFIIDLGSRGQRNFDPGDVRSTRNTGTGLPGAVQRCASQSGVFRLAAGTLPVAAPKRWEEALKRGLFRIEGDRLTVPAAPVDMRKPCLEYFMALTEAGEPNACEIFRKVGEALAATWRETQYILNPACKTRTLFGRLVKSPACFERMREGARRVAPSLRLEAADESLANSPLMRQLANHPVCTVAQFGQTVGAIYYGCVAG